MSFYSLHYMSEILSIDLSLRRRIISREFMDDQVRLLQTYSLRTPLFCYIVARYITVQKKL